MAEANGTDRRVAMLGLGTMGGAMARNLVERGWRVTGYDVVPERCQEAEAAGVSVAASPVAAAAEAPTVLTSLPSPKALLAVSEAIAAAGLPPRTVAELSTLALADKEAGAAILAAGGHTLLDCPLSGTGAQAAVRDLVVYASGDPVKLDALRPVFMDFARAVHEVGPFGHGTKMKFVANLLVAINNVASAEAMVLGMKAGLDPAQLVQLVSAGAATSRIFELRAPMMAANRYEPATMTIALWQKDMQVIGDFAREMGCPTPLFAASDAFYRAALANGQGAEDTASVCAVYETMAGLTRP